MSDMTDDEEFLEQYSYLEAETGTSWTGWEGLFADGPFDGASWSIQAPVMASLAGARVTVGFLDIGQHQLDPENRQTTWHRYEFTQRPLRPEEEGGPWPLFRTFLSYRGQVPTRDYLERQGPENVGGSSTESDPA